MMVIDSASPPSPSPSLLVPFANNKRAQQQSHTRPTPLYFHSHPFSILYKNHQTPFFPLIYLPFRHSSPLLLFTHLSLFNKLNNLHSRSLPALYIPQTNSFELPLITTYPSPTIQTRIIFKMFSKLTAVFAIVAAAGELFLPLSGSPELRVEAARSPSRFLSDFHP